MAFECPKCKRVSHHPDDERHGYCGDCHEFTAPTKGNVPNAGSTHITVDGIVAARDKEPYVRLIVNGEKAQITIAEAHKIANDLLKTAARTEADAMLFRFFQKWDFPEEAAVTFMQDFRYYRQMQDDKPVDQNITDPDTGERIR